jgi:biopolymer transport protein ExbB
VNEAIRRLLALLEEGSYTVMAPLIAVCIVMWAFIAERSLFLFAPSGPLALPSKRRVLREAKAAIAAALESYIEAPSAAGRARLLDLCLGHLTPYTRFILRAMGTDDWNKAHVRDLRIAESALRGNIEIERGLGIISVLAKAAPLMGLLGTVIGMIKTFSVMMVAATSDPRALSSGISIALIATEVGLVVALPGVLGMSWLSRRAQVLEEEIHLASLRLRQVGQEAPGEAYA